MVESLEDLDNDVGSRYGGRLCLYYGDTMKVIKTIHDKFGFDYLSMNMDYTPFAKKRDGEIMKWGEDNDIKMLYEDDICLHPINSVLTGNGEVYKVFTPYFRSASKIKVRKTEKEPYKKGIFVKSLKTNESISIKDAHKFYDSNKNVYVHGGRKEGLKIVSKLGDFKNYGEDRDIPSIPSTMLSAYNKFGCISIRELHETIVDKLGKDNKLYTQLYWRDFYYNIAYEYGHVFKGAFKEKYNNLEWDNDRTLFNKWKNGETGVPIIDAGMRQLNTTGFMHNRLRMMVSMFLTKDLHIDWRWGEKYFATKLVDYDPIANNQGWMWTTGCGTDASIWFRIFNPFTQGKNFDPKCEYIKQWLPVLKDVPDKDIHNWFNTYEQYKELKYSEPIVEHDKERLRTLEIYKKALK
jgi:deoxyribodipyrimidine photo-lyase